MASCAGSFGKPERSEKGSQRKSVKSFVHELRTAETPDEVTRSLIDRYPEIHWFAGKVEATPEARDARTSGQSPSERFFGEKHIEFDRTVTGILVLKWVLDGNYDAFTSVQKDSVKMTRENFGHLRRYTNRILSTDEAIEAMIAFMVIHDLGKVTSVVEAIQKRSGVRDVDHDNVWLYALENLSGVAPSFEALPRAFRETILRGLRAQFNIGQLLQGENVPASLKGLRGLDTESLDFYLLHALADIAGAAGHVNSNGSIVMTNPTYEGFRAGIRALEGLGRGRSEVEVYNDFLASKGKPFGLRVEIPAERTVIRLLSMLRASDAQTVSMIREAFEELHPNVRAILTKEMSKNGVSDGIATLLYYSPAFLSNMVSVAEPGNASSYKAHLSSGLTLLAELYQRARIELKGREGNGVFTVLISDVAADAKSPDLAKKAIEIEKMGDDAHAKLRERNVIDSTEFPQINDLSQVSSGQRVGVIGIGGGSDGVQAAQLGLLMRSTGRNLSFVVSVRTDKTGSQGPNGGKSEARTIFDHGGEITDGVYRVLPTSHGSGRFLENIPASEVPMFLVIDTLDGKLTKKIEAVVKAVGGADTVLAVDTGGDALYSLAGSAGLEKAKSTPDQDLRVLQALGDLRNLEVKSAIIATGVDTPQDAGRTLHRANAQYYETTPSERAELLERYELWEMTGTNDSRFGKTPLTWQQAMGGQKGLTALSLPERVVLDESNPWNPFVRIDPSMSGIFFMNVGDHLTAIGSE